MPKAKPTQVIVHRLELQQSERDTLEAALAGRFVTNAVTATGSVLSGIGTMLVPFSGALTAIAGLWIAEKGGKAIVEAIDTAADVGGTIVDFYSPSKQLDAYAYITAFLKACSGWSGDDNSVAKRAGQLLKDLKGMNAHPILLFKFQSFMKVIKRDVQLGGNWPPYTPAKAWIAYYSPSQYIAELKATVPGL